MNFYVEPNGKVFNIWIGDICYVGIPEEDLDEVVFGFGEDRDVEMFQVFEKEKACSSTPT